jgi:prepilin-type N-terminal cleavage/methylation domain-containing protein
MTTSATGNKKMERRSAGFTLVELLAVVAIMAIVISILGYAISNMGGSATQVAASQVASGLSLARQLAVSKNTDTRFVVANLNGATGAGLPQESFRYWTVLMTNKNATNPTQNSWFMMKEWEKLPQGVVFLNVAVANYSTITNDPIGATVGAPFAPAFSTSLGANNEWRGFASYGPFDVAVTNQPNVVAFRMAQAPAIGYSGVGEALYCSNSSRGIGLTVGGQAVGIRVASGAVTPDGQLTLKATNNYYYVETDRRGRVRVRSPESYR